MAVINSVSSILLVTFWEILLVRLYHPVFYQYLHEGYQQGDEELHEMAFQKIPSWTYMNHCFFDYPLSCNHICTGALQRIWGISVISCLLLNREHHQWYRSPCSKQKQFYLLYKKKKKLKAEKEKKEKKELKINCHWYFDRQGVSIEGRKHIATIFKPSICPQIKPSLILCHNACLTKQVAAGSGWDDAMVKLHET